MVVIAYVDVDETMRSLHPPADYRDPNPDTTMQCYVPLAGCPYPFV
jgi:hypothetical protein